VSGCALLVMSVGVGGGVLSTVIWADCRSAPWLDCIRPGELPGLFFCYAEGEPSLVPANDGRRLVRARLAQF
jgi:hypothetical protein